MAEGRLEADVIERCHLLATINFARILNRPLCQLGDAKASLLVLLVLFNSHLSIALEGKEVAFRGLEADRGAKGDWFLRVAVFEVEQGQFLALAHFKVGYLNHQNDYLVRELLRETYIKNGVMASGHSVAFSMVDLDIVIVHNTLQCNL